MADPSEERLEAVARTAAREALLHVLCIVREELEGCIKEDAKPWASISFKDGYSEAEKHIRKAFEVLTDEIADGMVPVAIEALCREFDPDGQGSLIVSCSVDTALGRGG